MRTTRSIWTAFLLVATAHVALVLPAAAQDWTQTSLPMGYQYALTVAPNGDVYAFGGNLVRKSVDDGVTWTELSAPPQNSFPHSLTFSPSGVLFAGDFALGAYRSDDGGQHWSPTLTSEGCNSIAVSPEGVVFAGLTYTGNGKVHRSVDLGGHWDGIALPGASQSFATECFAFGDSGEVYAGTIDGFYRSNDLGVTWEQRGAEFLGRHVRTMVVAPDQRVYAHTLYPAQIDGLYRSSDRGRTWERLGGNAPYFSALAATLDGTLWGSSEAGVYLSSNSGVSWSTMSSGIATNERLTSLVVTPSGRLLTGGYRVYRSNWSLLDVNRGPARAAGAMLGPAHPNPLSGVTRIGFTLARRSPVELAVFDLAGRRVALLANDLREPGEHAVTLDGSALPAGVYRCRLVADGVVSSRPLVVLH